MGVLFLLASCILIISAAIYHVPASNTTTPPWNLTACTNNGGTSDCTVTNSYGSFPESTMCRDCNCVDAFYLCTEAKLIAAVAAATMAKRKAKVVTRHSPQLHQARMPRQPHDGTIISTRWFNWTLRVDVSRRLLMVESGMVLKDLIEVATESTLALPHLQYWNGLAVGGLLATSPHGSSLWGIGSAVHEYVVGIKIVAPASQGFIVVRELSAGTIGNKIFVECKLLCQVPNIGHSVKSFFTVYQTRHSKTASLPRAIHSAKSDTQQRWM